MKQNMMIKIVATGGETTWLLVCCSALLCSVFKCFCVSSFTKLQKSPCIEKKLCLLSLTLFPRENPPYSTHCWCLDTSGSGNSAEVVKKTQPGG